MTTPILFPYHPSTGLRLEKTIDFIPAGVPHQITKEAGEVKFEFTGGSQLNWDASETQQVGKEVYLADSDGTECLLSEAIWSEVEEDSIALKSPGTHTSVVGANTLRDQLRELASSTREVVLDVEQGTDPEASTIALKAMLVSLGLWEEFEPDAE
ncbi:hypothetical protein QO021_28800 (plasmid) [Pseudomonas amygdali pv. lachrymans]|uniref:hypothetical protein n=1 Tax=Pseudomonas amygdali TaxID=47877 RepID=UPI0006B88D3F|nr:hypothetical protein [Pseudomonas amygdali]RMM39480.1 hypothetical protein ALQ79_200065 [Pseudomonas amygdali pv. lachrymans]WIO61559.1 hypothetical protein QO021_28800 [Pseudomonas amygdali pv. lachrymans]